MENRKKTKQNKNQNFNPLIISSLKCLLYIRIKYKIQVRLSGKHILRNKEPIDMLHNNISNH